MTQHEVYIINLCSHGDMWLPHITAVAAFVSAPSCFKFMLVPFRFLQIDHKSLENIQLETARE